MSVLGYAACDKDRQRYYAAGIQGHENHVRAGFRDDADGYGKEYHQSGIVAYPTFNVYIVQPDTENGKYALRVR